MSVKAKGGGGCGHVSFFIDAFPNLHHIRAVIATCQSKKEEVRKKEKAPHSNKIKNHMKTQQSFFSSSKPCLKY